MAQQIQDEGFHEIQLNAKQLEFCSWLRPWSPWTYLSMPAVLEYVDEDPSKWLTLWPVTNVAETTPTVPATPAPAPAAGSDPTAAAPPPPADDLSYFNRLEKSNAPVEKLKPASERPAALAEKPAAPPAPARAAAVAPHGALHPLRNRRCRHLLPFLLRRAAGLGGVAG